MSIIIQRVLTYLLWQLVAALVGYGFVFGFIAFLGLLACCGLITWCYWRYVVSRPRVQACGAFVGEYLGDRYYCMEGAL